MFVATLRKVQHWQYKWSCTRLPSTVILDGFGVGSQLREGKDIGDVEDVAIIRNTVKLI